MIGALGDLKKASIAALRQLTTFEVEVQRKIKAENDYYEQVMRVTNKRAEDTWKAEQPWHFEQEVKKFVHANANVDVKKIGPKLITLLDDTKKGWADRDKMYEKLVSDTQTTLRDNRKKLELERSEIKKLRNQLQTLSSAPSNKEMLNFFVTYARQVNEEHGKKKKKNDSKETNEDKTEDPN